MGLSKQIRAALGWLIIVAFVARGLIPVGYMPDFTGKTSTPALRICGTTKSSAPNAPSLPHHDDACPFGVNAVFGLDGMQSPLAAHIPYLGFIVLALAAFALTPQRRFGNASPRAPPLFS